MKERLTSFDVRAVAGELDRILKNARVQKTYQVDEEELRIRLYTGERRDLVISPTRVHLTRYPKPAPREASGLAMAIRKRTRGGFVREVRQYGFDRILVIVVETAEGEVELVIEMFGEGNIALLKDGVTEICMRSRKLRDRDIVPGEEYSFPESRPDPSDLDGDGLVEVLKGSDKDLVRGLATELGLGGLYAEEVVARTGIDKHLAPDELGPHEAGELHAAVAGLFEELRNGDPVVVYRDGDPVDATPVELKKYGGLEEEPFDSFNEALDEYFSTVEVRETGRAEERWRDELDSLEDRLEHQERAAERYESRSVELKEMGDLLYSHYGEVSRLLEAVREGRSSGLDEEEVVEAISGSGYEGAELLKELDGTVAVLELDGREVEVDYRLGVPENAEELYSESKGAREKVAGAEDAAEETREKLKELREGGPEVEERVPQRRVRRPERWFHEYRWFRTSNGDLVVAGRNASQNEELGKKHLEEGDLFLHTEVEGGPVTVLKDGSEATDRAVEEAATFALSTSSIWKEGFFSGDVYAAAPEQVSKTPESGEFLPKGAFVVRGERGYFRGLGVSHCVGLTVEGETVVMGGPCSAVKAHCKYWFELEPGGTEGPRVADGMRRELKDHRDEEDRTVVERVATQEAIVRALPPGGSEVVDRWR